jgi:hypothetical protein
MFETLAIQALGVMSIVVGIVLAAFSIHRYASVKRSLQDLLPSDGDDTDG